VVTVLSRIDSSATFPSAVKVHKTDYTSEVSVVEGLKGQDAVVSTIATAALANQKIIIDAAVKAGVKRFIPSEFGINTTKISGGIAKILATKIQIQKDHLKKAVEENEGFSWTGVSSSMFFDWVSTKLLYYTNPKCH
jgi:putative NADH-flavin reductase